MRLGSSLVCLGALVAGVGARADVAGDASALGAEVRPILEQRCGTCHDRAAARPPPKALAVFDLADETWWARLGDAQLPKLLGRLDGMHAPAAERARVAAFVAAENARRHAAVPTAR